MIDVCGSFNGKNSDSVADGYFTWLICSLFTCYLCSIKIICGSTTLSGKSHSVTSRLEG